MSCLHAPANPDQTAKRHIILTLIYEFSKRKALKPRLTAKILKMIGYSDIWRVLLPRTDSTLGTVLIGHNWSLQPSQDY